MKDLKNKKIVIASIIVLLVVLIGVLVTVFANKSYRFIKVSEFDGEVEISRNNSVLDEVYVDMLLKNKDTITTMSDGNVALLLDDEKVVNIDPESVVHILAKGNPDKATTQTTLVLEKGSITNAVNMHLGEKESYQVETPSVCMAVRGTEFSVIARQNDDGVNETYIEVTDGTVEAYRPDEADTIKIDAGFNVTIAEDEELSEIELEDNPQYFEFAFDINDWKVFGKNIKEVDYDFFSSEAAKLIDKYNMKLGEHSNGVSNSYLYKREDCYLTYSHNLGYDISDAVLSGYEWIEYHKDTDQLRGMFNNEPLDIEKHYWEIEGLVDILREDNILETPGVDQYVRDAQMRSLLCLDEIDKLLDEQPQDEMGCQEIRIKCNWSNDTYSLWREDETVAIKNGLRTVESELDGRMIYRIRSERTQEMFGIEYLKNNPDGMSQWQYYKPYNKFFSRTEE